MIPVVIRNLRQSRARYFWFGVFCHCFRLIESTFRHYLVHRLTYAREQQFIRVFLLRDIFGQLRLILRTLGCSCERLFDSRVLSGSFLGHVFPNPMVPLQRFLRETLVLWAFCPYSGLCSGKSSAYNLVFCHWCVVRAWSDICRITQNSTLSWWFERGCELLLGW